MLKYDLVDEDPVCQEFFYINPDTGAIYLRKLLTETTKSSFEVVFFYFDQFYE